MDDRERVLPGVVRFLVLAGLLASLGLGLGLAPARAEGPVVRALFFWAETCPYCHVVMDEVFPPLQERYGKQLEIATFELSEVPENYELWLAVMDEFGVPPQRGGVPMLFVGDEVLVGSGEIPERFPGLIEAYLAEGGAGYPDVPGLAERVEVAEEDPGSEGGAVAGIIAGLGWLQLLMVVAAGLLVGVVGWMVVKRF